MTGGVVAAPLIRVEIPVRAEKVPPVVERPWAMWRLATPVAGRDAHTAANLALPDRCTPVPVWFLRDDGSFLYPRDPNVVLPDVLVGMLLLPPSGGAP